MALMSQDKWEKTNRWISWIKSYTDSGESVPHKELERCQGFRIYVSQTYTALVPDLSSIHLPLESWRDWRDKQGWKLLVKEIDQLIDAMKDYSPLPVSFGALSPGKGPRMTTVKAVPRLKDDVTALSQLVRAKVAPS